MPRPRKYVPVVHIFRDGGYVRYVIEPAAARPNWGWLISYGTELAAGRCREGCGRPLTRFRYRCVECQAKERKRWRRKGRQYRKNRLRKQ